MAIFEGHPIDLAQGWGAASACLVARQQGVFECFRTHAELAARKTELVTRNGELVTRNGDVTPAKATTTSANIAAPQAGVAGASGATSSCSASLDLYSGPNYSGRQLSLMGEGYWQQLSSAGFDNTTVSFLGGACSFHLAQGNFGQGYWYPGNTGAWSFASDMGSWDRTVSSVYIN